VTTYLLDANVLIALTAHEHVHHERVSHWAAGVRHFALCPIVEGALTGLPEMMSTRSGEYGL